MTIFLLVLVATLYSTLTAALLLTFISWRQGKGDWMAIELVNRRFERKSALVLFEAFSYVSLAAWIALALPLIDLVTFQWFTHITAEGHLETYVGTVQSDEIDFIALAVVVNVQVLIAALKLIPLSRLLRRGRVWFNPTRFFWKWSAV